MLLALLAGFSSKVADGLLQTINNLPLGLPAKVLLSPRGVRLALVRVVLQRVKVNHFGCARPADLLDELDGKMCKVLDGEFLGVAEIDRLGVVAVHERNETINEVRHVLKRARRVAIAVDGKVFVFERLQDEIGNYAAVVPVHTRAICVEYPRNTHINIILAFITVAECLANALAFVVAGPRALAVDMAPVCFFLRVLLWIAVDFRSRGEQETGLDSLGQPKHVVGSKEACFEGLDGVGLVVDGASGASEMVDLVDLDQDAIHNVMADELKVRVAQPHADVGLGAGVVVVDANNVMAREHEPVDEVRADKAGAAGDQDALFHKGVQRFDGGIVEGLEAVALEGVIVMKCAQHLVGHVVL